MNNIDDITRKDAWHHAWSRVDETSDPDFFIRFLDSSRLKTIRMAHANPAKFFRPFSIKPGGAVLDIGCGTGEVLHPLRELVGDAGRIVGVDASARIIQKAQERADRCGVRVEFHVADVHNLPFPTSSFETCMSNAVFQHIENPVAALEELVRVTAPGGQITISESDWESQIVSSGKPDVTRRLVDFFSDSICNGTIARHLPAMFRDAGLEDVTVTPYTSDTTDPSSIPWLMESASRACNAEVISACEAQTWLHDVEASFRRGRFFAASMGFRVSGRRPNTEKRC